MYKELIEKHLKARLTEAQVPGVSVTKKAQNKAKDQNEEAMEDTAKKFEEYEDASAQEDTNAIEPKKRNHTDSEKEYHDDAELGNGMEALRYDNEPSEQFKDRAEKAIAGDPTMGNSPDYANVVPKQQGFTGPEFGKELVDKIKRAAKKRADATQALHQFGDDIEKAAGDPQITKRPVAVESTEPKEVINESSCVLKGSADMPILVTPDGTYKGSNEVNQYLNSTNSTGSIKIVNKMSDMKPEEKSFAGLDDARNYVKSFMISDNNKPEIKENKMKRLKFKQPFNGRKNAMNLIPEHHKVNKNIFEMTDGVETYKVRWEEDAPVVLESKNQNKINEDMAKMKHLMGYNSRETFGNLKGEDRIVENSKMRDFMNKSQDLITEDEEGNKIINEHCGKCNVSEEAEVVTEMEDPNDGTTKTETDPGDESTKEKGSEVDPKVDATEKSGKDLSMDKPKEIDPASGILENEEVNEDEEAVTEGQDHPDVNDAPVAKPGEEKTGSKGACHCQSGEISEGEEEKKKLRNQ